ncbi:MAG: hypothetical protein ABI162_02455 [Luteolibacter sp.]
MRLSLATFVVLRLFAINWMLTGVIALISSAETIQRFFGAIGNNEYSYAFATLLLPAAYLIMAFLAWFFAACLSKKITGGMDPTIGVTEISAEDLFTLGILVLGLTTCLTHLAPTINLIHYRISHPTGNAMTRARDGITIYQVTSHIIPCLAGLALAILSPKMGQRVARYRSMARVPENSPA